MGRKRSEKVIGRAEKIYQMLIEIGQPITTPELLRKAIDKGIVREYSSLYHVLRLLEKVGLVDHNLIRGTLEWRVLKVIKNKEELRDILAGRKTVSL
ncbi:MAG: hypothetical protein DRJ41_02440 [Thermoprotei archaeon]|nr:MAG: hypothetical protein DRJ41_02440 [Thermoprotei archaeon]